VRAAGERHALWKGWWLLLALTVAAAGCRVQTTVSVVARSPDRGYVSVSVSLDQTAVAAVGGRSSLVSQLSDADLVAEGWVVTGPRSGPGHTTVITASHSFSSAAEAATLVSDIAGSGPASSRPFRLELTHRAGFWDTKTFLSGTVDLRCGLDCFGDSGLRALFGTSTGVPAGPVGAHPGQVFSVSFQSRLPGSIKSSSATSVSKGTLRWSPAFGRATQLEAVSESTNVGSIVLVAVLAGVGLLGMALVLQRWRHRRRRMNNGRQQAPRKAVTPSA
jgi:hypothetical protein